MSGTTPPSSEGDGELRLLGWSQEHVTEPGYEATEHCPNCGSFAARLGPQRYECQRDDCGLRFSPVFEDDQPEWTPSSDADTAPRCDRCGARVSHEFHRVWAVDDVLDGCRDCLPRSVRFGEDIYGREKDDIEDFDPDAFNQSADDRGRDPPEDL